MKRDSPKTKQLIYFANILFASSFAFLVYISFAHPDDSFHPIILAVGDSYTYLGDQFESTFLLFNQEGRLNIAGITSYYGIIQYRNIFYGLGNYLFYIFLANCFLFYLAWRSFFYTLKTQRIDPRWAYMVIAFNPYIWLILVCLNKEILALSLISLWYFSEVRKGPFILRFLSLICLFIVRDIYVVIVILYYMLTIFRSRKGVLTILSIISALIPFVYPDTVVGSEDAGQRISAIFEVLNKLTMNGYHIFSFLPKTLLSILSVSSILYKGVYLDDAINIYGLTLSLVSFIYLYYFYRLLVKIYLNRYGNTDLLIISFFFVGSVSPIYNFRMYTPLFLIIVFSLLYRSRFPVSIVPQKSRHEFKVSPVIKNGRQAIS